MVEKGSLKAVIDRSFRLDEIVEAHRYVGSGEKKGHVILQLST
jgi:NADPH:quinone reductase-like Zn-dependent oxidoreductase